MREKLPYIIIQGLFNHPAGMLQLHIKLTDFVISWPANALHAQDCKYNRSNQILPSKNFEYLLV